MAKKFVQINGFNNAFSEIDSSTLNISESGLKSEVSSIIDKDSIAFIIADSSDAKYGYPEKQKYIWAHGELYASLNRLIKVNDNTLADSSIIDISTLKNMAISQTPEGKIIIDAISTAIDDATEENEGLASAYELQNIMKTVSAALNNLNTRLISIENNIEI